MDTINDTNDINNINSTETISTEKIERTTENIFEKQIWKLIFIIIELIVFFFPIIPEQLWIRVLIATSYFITHQYKIQMYYVKWKNEILNGIK